MAEYLMHLHESERQMLAEMAKVFEAEMSLLEGKLPQISKVDHARMMLAVKRMRERIEDLTHDDAGVMNTVNDPRGGKWPMHADAKGHERPHKMLQVYYLPRDVRPPAKRRAGKVGEIPASARPMKGPKARVEEDTADMLDVHGTGFAPVGGKS